MTAVGQQLASVGDPPLEVDRVDFVIVAQSDLVADRRARQPVGDDAHLALEALDERPEAGDEIVVRPLVRSVERRPGDDLGMVGAVLGPRVERLLQVAGDGSADRQRQRDDDDDWGSGPGVRDYLDGLQEDDLAPVTPAKRVSPTDPQARWTAAPGGPAFYAYSTNYLVDTDAGIIVDVEATPAHRTLEVESTRTMIERLEDRFAMKTEKLIGDTAYGTAEFLGWMVEEKGIEPHVPVGGVHHQPLPCFRIFHFHEPQG